MQQIHRFSNDRTSVPTLYSETKTLTESVYTRQIQLRSEGQWSQGNALLSMGKMNFEYNTFWSTTKSAKLKMAIKMVSQSAEKAHRKNNKYSIVNL